MAGAFAASTTSTRSTRAPAGIRLPSHRRRRSGQVHPDECRCGHRAQRVSVYGSPRASRERAPSRPPISRPYRHAGLDLGRCVDQRDEVLRRGTGRSAWRHSAISRRSRAARTSVRAHEECAAAACGAPRHASRCGRRIGDHGRQLAPARHHLAPHGPEAVAPVANHHERALHPAERSRASRVTTGSAGRWCPDRRGDEERRIVRAHPGHGTRLHEDGIEW